MDLDRPLDDIIKKNREARTAGGPKKKHHARGNSVRSTPYPVQRQHSANAVPTVPRGDFSAQWKHDLYKAVNRNTAVAANGVAKSTESILQFPPKRLSETEKSQLLKANPLFQRMDNGKPNQVFFPPPSTPTAPATMKKSFSTPNLAAFQPPKPDPQPPKEPQSISIAGIASANVILSNLASTVSVEDIKATLRDIGGGVKEVHIISTQGGSLQVKVSFWKPEGARECVGQFNGITADGRIVKAALEKAAPAKREEISFLNRQGEQNQGETLASRGKSRRRGGGSGGGGTGYVEPQYTGLYSDQMLGGQKR